MRTRLAFTTAIAALLLAAAACSRAAEITAPRPPAHPARTDGTTDGRGPGYAGGGN